MSLSQRIRPPIWLRSNTGGSNILYYRTLWILTFSFSFFFYLFFLILYFFSFEFLFFFSDDEETCDVIGLEHSRRI